MVDHSNRCRERSSRQLQSPRKLMMPKLLVVDDDELILNCFRYAFPAEHLELVTARTSAEAVAAFRSNLPDVVVTDNRRHFLSALRYGMRVETPAEFVAALKSKRA